MTDAKIQRLYRQLRNGAEGYARLALAVEISLASRGMDSAASGQRALENMKRLHAELSDMAAMLLDPPKWLREVKL